MTEKRGARAQGQGADVETEGRRQARAIELFHLAFLEVASIQLRPIEAFAVKGGVNLRFFLGSRRRSADLDLDHLGTGQPVVGPIDAELARRLGGLAVRLQHYSPPVAIAQKVTALAGRSATEPRDVFDLDHLFRAFPDAVAEAQLDGSLTRSAVARALEIRYSNYRALVVDYLDEDLVDLYSGQDAWADMVLRVTGRLEEAVGGPA